jgi:omega-6 fatty acid desaturase (delta-12 desaturase)
MPSNAIFHPGVVAPATPLDPATVAKDVARHVAAFRGSDDRRAALELLATAAPFAALWVLMWVALDLHYGVVLLLSVPAACLLLRLFLIQHDCGHGAFFKSRRANDWTGRCIGVLTLSPYGYWRRTHATHHASTGDLDRRGFGDIETLTVDEFAGLGGWGRLRYRLYRHPVVMFALGPAFVFLLQHRLPVGLMRAGWRPWISVMGTNAAIASLWIGFAWLVGVGPFLLIQLPVTVLAASAGVWLFYVQHQFEHTHWSAGKDWSFHEAALYGSSHYVLPPVLRWFTANIGLHHIHHLCSTVPFYRLPAVLAGRPDLLDINRLTLAQSLKAVRLVLWDPQSRRLVPFSASPISPARPPRTQSARRST